MSPTSLILRFRDLVTGPSETIAKHKQLADAHGYVWWGWWHKSGERAPLREIGELRKAAPFQIHLVDSGQGHVYQARCDSIEAHPFGDLLPSPDATKTPEYYNQQKYRAWYRLGEFRRIPDDEATTLLRGLAYVQVDAFFEDQRSPFTAFYGKRIYDVRELIQQNRTVWFTRPAAEGDPSHEVALLNAEHARPHHFAPTYFSTASRTILWVSDLHFSEGTHHAFPVTADAQRKNLWLALDGALKDAKVEKLAGLIVSGDLTWRASRTEFDLARTAFLDRLASTHVLDPRQIVVRPGNHDIAFATDPAKKGAIVDRAARESESEYRRFYEAIFRLPPNDFLSSGRRLLIGGVLPVDVISLNSSLLQQHPDFITDKDGKVTSPLFQGQGFLGSSQLDAAAKEFRWDASPFSPLRAFRIVVLHHHVLPVTEAELAIAGGNYSMVLDAERLSRWLVRHRVDLVLHGHQHQPFSVAIRRGELVDDDHKKHHAFRVLGMGSTGVAQDHLGPIAKNTFGLLEFKSDGVKLDCFSLHPSERTQRLFEIEIPYERTRSAE